MTNFEYRRQGGLNVEVIIRDESMSKIEVLRCNAKDFYKIARILYKKYGIRYKPEVTDKDLEWTKKS